MKLLKKVYESRMDKKSKSHEAYLAKHRKETQKVELKRLEKSKEIKKGIYRRLGKSQNKKNSREMPDDWRSNKAAINNF